MGDTKFRQSGRRTARGPYRSDEKQRRAEEARLRNEAWASLNTDQKIASLRHRRGMCKRQFSKLIKAEVASGKED